MYRLLVVDDEPILVDGIYRLLQEEEGLELDLYRAYSGDEALEKLSWMRFDIVLSDIRMPGMSGLELQGHITDRWPACKVIFLTGHPDFEYVQAALRGKSIDYILKTESDEEVVASVRKAIDVLKAESQNARFLDKAAEQLQLAIPTLQRDYLQGLCEGTKALSSLKPELLKELHIPLQLQEPLIVVIGRVDRWPESITKASDKALMMFAIHNIAKEYFMPCSIQAVNTDYNRFIWLLQPEASPVSSLPAADPSWIRTIRFVHGTLERIQAASLQLLKVPISVAAGKSAVEWKDLSSCYDKLRNGLSRGLGIGQGTMIIEDQQTEESARENEMQKQTIRHLVKKLTASDFHFENVDKEEFMKLILDISERLEPFYEESDFFLELYYAVASHLLSQVNRWGDRGAQRKEVHLDKISNYQLHATRREAFHYLIQAALQLFESRDSEKTEHTRQVVETINRYVEEHLDKDLSLTTLSEIIYLNPYYMSRLYKQITGINLSEYITEARLKKAKKLVTESQMKMHEIARQVGFESPAYFTRIFKKNMGRTPQEYRELSRSRRSGI